MLLSNDKNSNNRENAFLHAVHIFTIAQTFLITSGTFDNGLLCISGIDQPYAIAKLSGDCMIDIDFG
jgi:hypothetical protein